MEMHIIWYSTVEKWILYMTLMLHFVMYKF